MFPTQNPAFPKGPSRLLCDFSDFDSPRPKTPVSRVPLDYWGVLRDYLVLICLVLWCFTIFRVIFDEKSEKVDVALSPIFAEINIS